MTAWKKIEKNAVLKMDVDFSPKVTQPLWIEIKLPKTCRACFDIQLQAPGPDIDHYAARVIASFLL